MVSYLQSTSGCPTLQQLDCRPEHSSTGGMLVMVGHVPPAPAGAPAEEEEEVPTRPWVAGRPWIRRKGLGLGSRLDLGFGLGFLQQVWICPVCWFMHG